MGNLTSYGAILHHVSQSFHEKRGEYNTQGFAQMARDRTIRDRIISRVERTGDQYYRDKDIRNT